MITGWGAGQLEAECARGVRLPVSASKHAVLRLSEPAGAVEDYWHYVAQVGWHPACMNLLMAVGWCLDACDMSDV